MLGLVLASDKTNVWKATTLAARRVDANEFLQEYFAKAETALTTIEFLFGGYGIEDVIEVPPGDEETVKEALRRIFEDWYTQQAADLPHHSQYLPASLRILAGAEERLPNNWLIELVFRQPLRLENVCSYLMARQEPTENWQTLSELAEMKRQSPWAKLWLLYVAAAQPRDEAKAVTDFDAWAGLQIVDRHEVVRSQAAWYLTISPRSIGPNQLGVLYREASNFDSPGNRR